LWGSPLAWSLCTAFSPQIGWSRWTTLFLVSTAATNITGFLFPFKEVTPGIVIGVLSLIVLAFAVLGRFAWNLTGAWRPIYIVAASVALYFNVFVFVVQSFEKVPQLRALAPTQKEPPFAVAQLFLLLFFVVATGFALKRFRPDMNLAGKSDDTPAKSSLLSDPGMHAFYCRLQCAISRKKIII
jgi:hypothetical protein